MKIEITLNSPICQCKKQNLGWSIREGRIEVCCNTCDASLFSSRKVKATLIVKEGYPEGLISDNNILQIIK